MYSLGPVCISDQNYIINFPPQDLTLDFAPLWWPSWIFSQQIKIQLLG